MRASRQSKSRAFSYSEGTTGVREAERPARISLEKSSFAGDALREVDRLPTNNNIALLTLMMELRVFKLNESCILQPRKSPTGRHCCPSFTDEGTWSQEVKTTQENTGQPVLVTQTHPVSELSSLASAQRDNLPEGGVRIGNWTQMRMEI